MWLFDVFGNPRSSFFECYYRGDLSVWQPSTEAEKIAFAELTDLRNRDALKKWFADVSAVNPGAEALRKILEKAVGEDLPVGRQD